MSVPLPNSGTAPFRQATQTGPTSYVTGQVNYGWIGESWRLFSAQMGPWIVATLLLSAPMIVFYIVYYAYMLTMMFPNGLNTPPPPPPGANGLPSGPLTPGPGQAQINAQMRGLLPLIFGFGIVFSFWAAYMNGGLFRMAVRQVRGVPIEMKDIFRGGPLFGRMLGATFLLGLAGYALEALCFAPMGLAVWRHGAALAIGLTAALGFILVFVLVFLAYGLLLPAFALIADGVGIIPALKTSARAVKPRMWAAAGFVFVYGLLVYASELLCGIGLLATIPMAYLICALAYRDLIGMPNMAPPPMPFYAPAAAGVWPPAPGTWPQNAPPPQWGSTPETPAAGPPQAPPPYPGYAPPQYPPPQYPPPADPSASSSRDPNEKN